MRRRCDALAAEPAGGGPPTGGWALVRRAQRGDAEAFGALFTAYRQYVHDFVTSMTKDHALAEDVTSETFIRLLTRIDSVHDRGRDVAAWLTTVARNLVLDHMRSSPVRRDAGVEPPELPTGDAAPEWVVIHGELASALSEALLRLTASQRTCLQLRFLDGLSPAETARRMGKPPLAVRQLQFRALRGLADCVAPDWLVS